MNTESISEAASASDIATSTGMETVLSSMSDSCYRTITTVDTEDGTIDLLDDDDDVAATEATTASDGLRICYVVEPSPLTYFCGYATMFQPLFSYALNEQSDDSIVLVTSECNAPQPSNWSPTVLPVVVEEDEEEDKDQEVVQYLEQQQGTQESTSSTTPAPRAAAVAATVTSNTAVNAPPARVPLSRSSSFCSDSSSSISSSIGRSGDSTTSCSTRSITGIRKREMPVHHTYGMPVFFYPTATMAIDYTMKLGRVLFQQKPDIVHATMPCTFDFPNILYCRLLNIPLLFSYHTHITVIPVYYLNKERWEANKSSPLSMIMLTVISFLEWLAWVYLRIIHFFADSVIVVSTEIQQEFKARGMDTDVWQKGIDTDKFNPCHYSPSMRQRMTDYRTDNPFILIHSGRFAVEKRIHLLKDVMDKLPNDVHLCLVGSGPDEQRLREIFANDLDRVTFTGYLSGTDLSQVMASADTFVMQSDSETLGLVVLESLASCVPVVGVNALGVAGSIQHNETGYLCDNTSPSILVDSIVHHVLILKNDKQLRTEMGIAARADMMQWSWAESCAKLRKEQYSQCIVKHSQRADVKLRQYLFGSSKATNVSNSQQEVCDVQNKKQL